MHDDEWKRLERLSALADGQLDGDEFAQTMTWVAASEQAGATWHAYHVMGDVLRSADLTDCSRDRAFAARLRERLKQTDAVGMAADDADANAAMQVQTRSVGGAAAMRATQRSMPSMAPVVADAAIRSANDAALRWKWLAAAASLMAVAVLGWRVDHVGTEASTRLAATPATGSVETASAAAPGTEPPAMLRDARLDELLAAHRQFGGMSALQTPAGFLRNATFEQPAR